MLPVLLGLAAGNLARHGVSNFLGKVGDFEEGVGRKEQELAEDIPFPFIGAKIGIGALGIAHEALGKYHNVISSALGG